MRLKIEVEKVEFDAEQCTLRINGRNTQEHEHVKLGQYHTIELEVGHPVGLEKPCWDAVHFRILDESCDLTKRAELAVVVMQEGLAYLCLITPSMTLTKLKIERSMPKKRQGGGGEEFEKAKRKFFHDILEGIRKHIDFSIVKAVLIGRSVI